MATYSHSKISTYEQCPYKYRLQYIDKIEVETPTTIEAFMGDLVHRTLEKLYADLKFQKTNSKQELLDFFEETWEKEYTKDILIVKKSYNADNYRKMGKKFITDYYESHKPFDDMTILGLETQDKMTLADGSQWHVRIDKLGCKGTTYYVCDYKSNSKMKDQEEADSDRQLAMYSSWVKDKFKDAGKVILKWHMLAFDKEITSERSDAQIKKLQDEVIKIIKEIESAKDFPRKVSALCDYCVYKGICPSFKHEAIIEKKDRKEFKKDQGVKLVDTFAEVKAKKKEIEEQEDELRKDLIGFSKQFDVDVVYGSNMKVGLKEFDKLVLPEEETEYHNFVELLKKKGHWEACSMICYPKIQSKVIKKELHPDLIEKVRLEKDTRLSLSKRKDLEEE